MVLTYVDQLLGLLAWSWTLNKSWSLSGVEQTLQALIQLLSGSNSGFNSECSAVLALEIFLSLIDNSELTCCDIFIFQIHMVTQLDSLIGVEVNFVLEKMKQVSSSLEFIWMFEVSFKFSKD